MAGELFGAVIKYRGAVPKIAVRKRNEVYKLAYRETMEYWHAHFRLKHFTHAGAREYGYTPRKGEAGSNRKFAGSYTQRKLRKYGHTRPLEFTGESKARSANANITATSRGARCRMNLPRLNWKHPKSLIAPRDEMTRISPAERQFLQTYFEQRVQAGFAAITTTETVTV